MDNNARLSNHPQKQAAPPALDAEGLPPSNERVLMLQFLTDVVTAAGLLRHGRTDKKLAERIGDRAFHFMPQFARQSAPEGAPVGMVMVPVELAEDMSIAFAEAWFSKVRPIDDCGMEDCYAAMLAAAPQPAHQDQQPAQHDHSEGAR